MKRRRLWFLAGVAAVVAAVSLLMVPAFGEAPVLGEVGVLHLHLDAEGGGDKFVYNPGDSDTNLEQTLSESNCKLTSDSSLVQVVGLGSQHKQPFAGLKDHRLGVGQKFEGTGEPCARINKDLGQALSLSLTGALEGQAIGYAEIDLGFKYNGDAVLELWNDGSKFQTIPVPCRGGSDCGPDSGKSDNERVILWLDPNDNPGPEHWQAFQINGVFDKIVIKASGTSKAAVSLEGGFNGSPAGPLGISLGNTDDTLFKIMAPFDGEIPCVGDGVSLAGEHATHEIDRGQDTDGDCKGPEDGLLFNFDSGTDGDELFVDFITEPVDSDLDTVAQFLEVITWRFDSAPNVDAEPPQPQHRTLSYDDHLTETENKRVMPWCLNDPRDGNGDLPVGIPDPVDPTDYLPPGHTSCLIESSSRVTGIADILSYPLGTFIKVDIVYNIGDGKRYT